MWLRLPGLSVCSAEWAGSILDLSSLSQRLSAAVTWNGKERRPSAWLQELKRGVLTQQLSGLTYELSQADAIVESHLSALRGASPASICPLLGSGSESTPGPDPASGGSISASSESLAPSGPSSRTSPDYSAAPALMTWNPESQQMESLQTGLFETSTPYLGRFPSSGSMRNGALSPRQTWEPATDAGESSFWPTAQAHDAGGMRGNTMADHHHYPHDLTNATDEWRTPDAGERGGFNKSPSPGAANRPTLATQGEQWLTPHGMGNTDASGKTGGAGGGEFANQANNWGTPRATTGQYCNQRDGSTMLTVQGQAEAWQQPGSESLPPVPQTQSGKTCWCNGPGCDLRSHKRRLNPLFVTYLMGWPIWWLTSGPQPSAAPAMALYLSRQRLLLRSLLGGLVYSDSEAWPTPRVDAGPYSQHGPGSKKFQTSLEYVARDWDQR